MEYKINMLNLYLVSLILRAIYLMTNNLFRGTQQFVTYNHNEMVVKRQTAIIKVNVPD